MKWAGGAGRHEGVHMVHTFEEVRTRTPANPNEAPPEAIVSAAYDCLVSARSIVCFLFSGLLSKCSLRLSCKCKVYCLFPFLGSLEFLDWQSLLLVRLLVSPGACWFYRKPKHSSKQYMQDTHIPRR